VTLDEIKGNLREFVPAFTAKVQPIYELLEWEWSPNREEPHIPQVAEIEETLYTLIDGLTGEYVAHSSGGLEAYYSMPNEVEPGCYGLRFSLESQTAFDVA